MVAQGGNTYRQIRNEISNIEDYYFQFRKFRKLKKIPTYSTLLLFAWINLIM